MKIIDLLKSDKCASVVHDNPFWLYWDSETNEWFVKEHTKGGDRVLYRGKSEEAATQAMFDAILEVG